jgi:hypothetical protein
MNPRSLGNSVRHVANLRAIFIDRLFRREIDKSNLVGELYVVQQGNFACGRLDGIAFHGGFQ